MRRILLGAVAVLILMLVVLWIDYDFAKSDESGIFRNELTSSVLTFEHVILDAQYLAYQRDVGDIDGNGQNDIVGIGWTPACTLFWFRAPDFAREKLSGDCIYGDDLKLADIDGDGDPDVVTRVDDPNQGPVVWYENPRPDNPVSSTWSRHNIGNNAYTKDIVVRDFDGDNKLDVVTRGHAATQIWFQDTPFTWTKIEFSHQEQEGMDVGDLDKDGDPDVVLNGFWYETPDNPRTGTYVKHNIDSKWNSSKVVVADVNKDGDLDVVLSNSEEAGYPVSWYSATNPKTGPWTEHIIVPQCDNCHNLQAADFNNDGHIDILAGGMTTSQHKGLTLYLGNGGASWTPLVIQGLGSYSAELGDIGDDGDIDIVGIRDHETLPTEIWENQLISGTGPSLDSWTYIQVSDNHVPIFGLAFEDVNGDAMVDILSGPYWYRNPGGDMTGGWTRESFPQAGGRNVDALLALDVDDDALADIIAMNDVGGVYWLEATDKQGSDWNVVEVGSFPYSQDNISSQGYKLAQIVSGGKPEIVLLAIDTDPSRGSIYYFEIPGNPEGGGWPKTRIVDSSNSDRSQGVGVGDIDGDGKVDVSGGFLDSDGKTKIAWWKNPGDGSPDWQRYPVGETFGSFPDRYEIAELSGDGRNDIVMGDEGDGGRLYWFEQPANPTSSNWPRHSLYDQQIHSLDVADMDSDGDTDIVSGEHRGTKKVAIWENNGNGTVWEEHVVSEGKESHLGARVADLDGDGDLDIISIAWNEYQFLHLWRNDSGGVPVLDQTALLPLVLSNSNQNGSLSNNAGVSNTEVKIVGKCQNRH